ncbi:hypothetical protein Tco_0191897, partial [Tanacetum coccineum]
GSHDEPQPSRDLGEKIDEGVANASGVDDQEVPESSNLKINTTRLSINTASANFRTGSLDVNTASPTYEVTNEDVFGDESGVDMSNINTSYQVPTTPNTRIHLDHPLENVIGDVQSSVQTRRVTHNAN